MLFISVRNCKKKNVVYICLFQSLTIQVLNNAQVFKGLLPCYTIQSQRISRHKSWFSNNKGTIWRKLAIFLASKRLSFIALLHISITMVSPITLTLLRLPSVTCLSCSYVYYRTAFPLLPDSTWHMPISWYLVDIPLFVTFLFKPHFPHSCCPPSVESPPMICACVSQYYIDSSDSFCYWLVTILHI